MATIDLVKLREQIEQQYLNPPPEADPDTSEVQKRFAKVYADMVVAVISEVESETRPDLVAHAVIMASVAGMLNLLNQMEIEEDVIDMRVFAISVFARAMHPAADFIKHAPLEAPMKPGA